MRGQLGNNITKFPRNGCIDDLTTERSLIRKLRGSLVCLADFIDMLSMCLYYQTLTDVLSTGAGIKCLYCIRIGKSKQRDLFTRNGMEWSFYKYRLFAI